jgi:hypothetical protein
MDPDPTLARLRRALFIILAGGYAGIGAELLLTGHYEDTLQLVPLAIIAAALAALGWYAAGGGASSLRVLQLVMGISLVSGVVGAFLHYRGNTEFELERTPELAGFALFREAITGATPALAPGTMVLLGVIGLAAAWRHPLLTRTGGRADGRTSGQTR